MCPVLVPCFDVIVIYSCLSYTLVVLYLSASASLTLTYSDPSHTYPEMFCLLCKHSMARTICAIMKVLHHKCRVSVFQWQKHTDHQCKVHVLYLNNRTIWGTGMRAL